MPGVSRHAPRSVTYIVNLPQRTTPVTNEW